MSTPSGMQRMLVINESGVYSATFRSRRPSAKAFRRWVTAEVLPSIRKTGSYTAPAAEPQYPPMLTPAQYEAERDRLEALQTRLAATPVVLTAEQFEQLKGEHIRVGKKVYLVTELIGILEHHGIPREVAKELTGHNSNTVRQHAFIARKSKRGLQ